MVRSTLLLAVPATALFLAACTQDFNSFEPTGTGSGGAPTTTSSMSSTGGSGGGPECTPTDVTKCTMPPAGDPCKEAICTAAGKCDLGLVAAHGKCATADVPAGVCDGADNCIECIDPSDCPDTTDHCVTQHCVPAGCDNGQLDAGETDVDCGGTMCAPCPNTKICALNTDCDSGFCDTTQTPKPLCEPCVDGKCDAGKFCDTAGAAPTNKCLTLKTPGLACSDKKECGDGNCVEGVCCNTACTGDCSSCLAKNNGDATDGTCDNVTTGTDFKGNCTGKGACGTKLCDAATGQCGLKGSGSVCNASSCASSTVENNPDTCDGTTYGCADDGGTTNCMNNYSCSSNVCNTTCTMNTQCAGGLHCDTAGNLIGTCHVCASDPDGCTGVTPHCDQVSGSTKEDTCVACAANAQCTVAGSTRCDLDSTHGALFDNCHACALAADCSANSSGHKCLTTLTDACGCTASTDCAASKPTCELSGSAPAALKSQCQECTTATASTDCASSTNGAACLTATDTCGCTVVGDCAGVSGKLACLIAAGKCVECTGDGDCTDNTTGHGTQCGSGTPNVCGCSGNGQCATTCNMATHVCN